MTAQHLHQLTHGDNPPHDHAHGTIDPRLLSSDRGIWALKWSLWGLLATALFQLAVVQISNSVASGSTPSRSRVNG